MEEFLAEGQLQDDAGWFHFHGTAYTGSLRRHQEPPHEDVEEDAVTLSLAPYVDPHYGDRGRDHRRYSHHHYHRPPPISFQQPRSPSPSPDATTAPARSNKRACIPASNKAILGLKEVVLTTTTTDGDDCAICLKALDDRRPDQEEEDTAAPAAADAETTTTTSALRVMPCSHIFHQHCIFQWLHRNAVCSLCRHQLPTTDDDDDDEEEEEEEEVVVEGDGDDNPNSSEGRRMPHWLRLFLEAEVERSRR